MIHTDALIVGAGPVGLWQVFQLGLLEVKSHVVDSLPAAGGQCAELYADKPIYDIPGLPVCSGQELTDRLLQQIRPFGAGLHFDQEVSIVEQQPGTDAGFLVQTSTARASRPRSSSCPPAAGAFMRGSGRFPQSMPSVQPALLPASPMPLSFGSVTWVVLGDGDRRRSCHPDGPASGADQPA